MARQAPSEDQRQIKPTWITKEEVASRLGWTLAKVTRATAKGDLNPLTDENSLNRYDPDEVNELMQTQSVFANSKNDIRKEVFHEYQLDTVRHLIDLVRSPREKIDTIQFAIIDRQQARITELEAQVEAGRKAREEALDQSAERAAAMSMLKNDQDIKKIATLRVMDTIGKLISGPTAIQLSPDQWEELLLANQEEKFLTDDQVRQAKEVVAKHKAASNGKGVVETVKKTMVDAVGEQKHD